MLKNQPNIELDNAIENCFKFFFSPNKVNPKKSLTGILDELKKDGSLYIYPRDLFLKITSQCNLRCKHCFYYTKQNEFDSQNDFSTEELFRWVEFFVNELNIINFTLTGGEPFLQKDILKLLKYLKSKNVSIQIQTNATLITEKIATSLDKILDITSDSIQVSLDGCTEKAHDKIRGKGNFQKTINGIKRLTDHNLNVSISYTMTSENLPETEGLYELCTNLKVRHISLGRFKVCSPEQAYLKPEADQTFIVISKLIDKLSDEKHINVKLTALKPFDFLNYKRGRELMDELLNTSNSICHKNLMCHRHEKVSICADGRMYLCPQTEQEELCLGDLRKKSFWEIWESRFDNVFFQERNLEKLVCRHCKYISLCNAGCPAEAYCKYDNINVPDGNCAYGEKLLEMYQNDGEISC